jgi:hypothetical protein
MRATICLRICNNKANSENMYEMKRSILLCRKNDSNTSIQREKSLVQTLFNRAEIEMSYNLKISHSRRISAIKTHLHSTPPATQFGDEDSPQNEQEQCHIQEYICNSDIPKTICLLTSAHWTLEFPQLNGLDHLPLAKRKAGLEPGKRHKVRSARF